jgi:hypothetical protein
MEFRVDCTCGAHVMVREGLAGTRRQCQCGRIIAVPPLHELRRQIGLPPYAVSPELVIEHLLTTGELLEDHTCVCCGAPAGEVLWVETECERRQVRESGGLSLPVLIVTGLLFGWWIWLFQLSQRRETREYGKDKIYRLPLAVCLACRPKVRSAKEVKKAMCRVPDYGRLLHKFPDATVWVLNA